jgi:hypothetical protein
MPARLVALAVGVAVIASAVLAFLVPSHTVVVGTNRVSLAHGSLIVPGHKHKCQRLPTVPRGADRVRVGIAGTYGGPVPALGVQIEQRRRVLGNGAVKPVQEDRTAEIPLLRPTLPATGRALICFNNPGTGFVSLRGELRKVASPRGGFVRRPVAGVIFVAPGSSSWLSRMGEIARRYGYGQAGALGPWTLSMVVLFGVAALLFALASLLDSGEREALRREWRELTTTEREAVRVRERDHETWEREEQQRQQPRTRQLQESRWKEQEDLRRSQREKWRRQEWDQ